MQLGFAVSFLYFVYGCGRYFYFRFSHKKETKKGTVKRNILRGVMGMAICFVIYLIITVSFMFEPLSGLACLCLPKFQ